MARDNRVRLTEGRPKQSVHGISRAHVTRPVYQEITKGGQTLGRGRVWSYFSLGMILGSLCVSESGSVEAGFQPQVHLSQQVLLWFD